LLLRSLKTAFFWCKLETKFSRLNRNFLMFPYWDHCDTKYEFSKHMFRNNGEKRRVWVWARSVFVDDDCNIFNNIYQQLHSREPTLVPHPHPPDYLKLSIDPKRTCSFWIYFNSTWCWCICAATINKNKSFSKETLSGLSLLIEKKNRCYYIVNFLWTLLTLSFSAFSTKTVSITLYIFVLLLRIEK